MELQVGSNLLQARDTTTSRRSALRSLGAGSVGLLTALNGRHLSGSSPLLSHPLVARRRIDAPPNIILILTDDLESRSLTFMPNVTALIGTPGTTFSSFLVTTPVCTPARASILRGQYAHNHGVLGNAGPNGGFATFHRLGHEASTVATWLQGAGYRTALVGKYLNGYPEAVDPTYVPPGWDEWSGSIDDTGKYFEYDLNENGRLVHYAHDDADYSTDVLAAKATRFIQSGAAANRPFFLFLATQAPHSGARPAPRHVAVFTDPTAPRPPSFNEADVSDKPPWLRETPELNAEQVATIDETYRLRLGSLLAVDEMVARIIEVLADTGVLDDTYIVVTSDNGYHLGEHRIQSAKRTPYEEVIRVPLLVRGPEVAAGRTEERIALNSDLGPTFADFAGVIPPEFVDGRSLAPLLRGEMAAPWRHACLIEGFSGSDPVALTEKRANRDRDTEQGGSPGFSTFRALRTIDQIYVEYVSGARELYDLRSDPYEIENAIATPDAGLLTQWTQRLGELASCAAVNCHSLEDTPLPSLAP